MAVHGFKDNKSLAAVVTTVNNQAPDENGNVNVPGGSSDDVVKSVNNQTPDGSGNVDIDTGVMKVNNQTPDGSGNVDIDFTENKVTYSGTPPYDITMQPNTLYYLGETAIQLLNLTFAPGESGKVAEYHIIFKSGSTATLLTLPTSVKKPTDFEILPNKMYELSICENLLMAATWEVL